MLLDHFSVACNMRFCNESRCYKLVHFEPAGTIGFVAVILPVRLFSGSSKVISCTTFMQHYYQWEIETILRLFCFSVSQKHYRPRTGLLQPVMVRKCNSEIEAGVCMH